MDAEPVQTAFPHPLSHQRQEKIHEKSRSPQQDKKKDEGSMAYEQEYPL